MEPRIVVLGHDLRTRGAIEVNDRRECFSGLLRERRGEGHVWRPSSVDGSMVSRCCGCLGGAWLKMDFVSNMEDETLQSSFQSRLLNGCIWLPSIR